MKVLVKSFSVKWTAVWGSSAYRILAPMVLWCPQPCWGGYRILISLLCPALSLGHPTFSHCHFSQALISWNMRPGEWNRETGSL